MTRNEAIGLLALVALIGSGIGVRSCVQERKVGGVWIEQSVVAERAADSGAKTADGSLPAPARGFSSGPASRISKLDLNRAGALDLAEGLPGIGEVKARAIVAWREQHGGFREVRDLLKVPGIGEGALEKIAPLVFVEGPEKPTDSSALTSQTAANALPAQSAAAAPMPLPASPANGPVNLNAATFEELQTLHNIGPVRARAILAYRQRYGLFRRVEDLEKVPGIGPGIVEQNRPRLCVR